MKLTKNFNLSEFASKDGAPFPPEVIPNIRQLAENLQVLRDYLGVPFSPHSGYRSPAHNKAEGGAKDSQHIYGKAGDIRVKGYTPEEVYAAIRTLQNEGKMVNGGLGLYDTFVHYDIRDYVARWDYRTT